MSRKSSPPTKRRKRVKDDEDSDTPSPALKRSPSSLQDISAEEDGDMSPNNKNYYCKYCNKTWDITYFKNSQQFGAHCSNCSRKPRQDGSVPQSPAYYKGMSSFSLSISPFSHCHAPRVIHISFPIFPLWNIWFFWYLIIQQMKCAAPPTWFSSSGTFKMSSQTWKTTRMSPPRPQHPLPSSPLKQSHLFLPSNCLLLPNCNFLSPISPSSGIIPILLLMTHLTLSAWLPMQSGEQNNSKYLFVVLVNVL